MTSQWIPASSWSVFAPVIQVSGVCFDEHGEILLLSPDGSTGWNLPGGKPEPGETWRTTLLRVVRGQACVELGEPALLGAFAVSEAGQPPSFQLRCAVRCLKLEPMQRDPATGTTFVRRMVAPPAFMEVVAIENDRPMLAAALRWAEKHPVVKAGPAPDPSGSVVPGGVNPGRPGTRGPGGGWAARGGAAAPRPRRRAGLG